MESCQANQLKTVDLMLIGFKQEQGWGLVIANTSTTKIISFAQSATTTQVKVDVFEMVLGGQAADLSIGGLIMSQGTNPEASRSKDLMVGR